ncbi:efflux RND transporter permease subunit, partial [Stenotrophomonas maltophilia]|uniref:efflux RND transporter permease subunit n=1 Tax=Stenotrophomonas maltophilia TaxID=40324 RepID=UPI0019531BE8
RQLSQVNGVGQIFVVGQQRPAIRIQAQPEKLAAYQTLSAYINHSIREDRQSVWIAQAEGRAKDGDDRTDSAILKMFHMSRKDEPFAEMVRALHFIPVSISYEYDPCDLAKARE